MKIFIIAYLVSSLAFPSICRSGPEVFKHVKDEKEYVCFDKGSAGDLLDLKIKFPKISVQLEKYKELSNVRSLEINTLTRIQTNLTEQTIALVDENVALQKKLDTSNKWYKHPLFWFGIGIVLSAVTFVALEEEYGPFFK